MKINRFGQASILSSSQLDEVCEALPGSHRICAYILRYCACRVTEGLSLKWSYISSSQILFPAPITKGSKFTRQVPIAPKLKEVLEDWKLKFKDPYKGPQWVIPGRTPGERLTRQSFDWQLRQVCNELGFEGCSTHSFRRSSITELSRKKIPLATIKSVSGHQTLQALGMYIEVSQEEKLQAVSLLWMGGLSSMCIQSCQGDTSFGPGSSPFVSIIPSSGGLSWKPILCTLFLSAWSSLSSDILGNTTNYIFLQTKRIFKTLKNSLREYQGRGPICNQTTGSSKE